VDKKRVNLLDRIVRVRHSLLAFGPFDSHHDRAFMCHRTVFSFCAALILGLGLAIPGPVAGAAAVRRSFEIHGNERTRASYINELASTCLDDSPTPNREATALLPYLNQCLQNSKLFSQVTSSVQGSDQGKSIRIDVVEKWTLIPAPFYSKSGKTTRGGLLVFDSNFLGQGLTLGLGATLSNLGHSYFTFFNNPFIAGSRFFSSLSAREEKSIFELKDRDLTIASILERTLGGSLSVGYHFAWFNLGIQYARADRSYFAHEDALIPDDYVSNSLGLNWDYDRRDYKLYFSEGLYLRARSAVHLGAVSVGQRMTSVGYTLSWQQQAWRNHALLLQANGLKITGGRLTDAERVGSAKGFRGIENRTAWAESYQSGTIEYQMPLKSFEYGTLTWALFVDGGHIQNRGVGDRAVDYTATGAGLYFYLKHLAIPGIGIETGSNPAYQGQFVNVAIGLAL